jgi:acetyl esterase/lipase
VRYAGFALAALLVVSGCQAGGANRQSSQTLAQARHGFTTHLIEHVHDSGPVEDPPATVFRLVHYRSPVGPLAAYLTPPRSRGNHPAIIWITGGDDNSISDVWSPASADDDQTAAQYRQAGITMMFPSLRGGNDNPGYEEGFMGEADDILAAADFLARQPGVDPGRIYLGGHSTGGTMALIESEYSARFRAVFSFGPVASPSTYDPQEVAQPWDPTNPQELYLRSPIYWLGSITKPTFVFEGTTAPSNIKSLRLMSAANTNPNVHFYPVDDLTHFSILAPVNELIAKKINADTGAACNIRFSTNELAELH